MFSYLIHKLISLYKFIIFYLDKLTRLKFSKNVSICQSYLIMLSGKSVRRTLPYYTYYNSFNFENSIWILHARIVSVTVQFFNW